MLRERNGSRGLRNMAAVVSRPRGRRDRRRLAAALGVLAAVAAATARHCRSARRGWAAVSRRFAFALVSECRASATVLRACATRSAGARRPARLESPPVDRSPRPDACRGGRVSFRPSPGLDGGRLARGRGSCRPGKGAAAKHRRPARFAGRFAGRRRFAFPGRDAADLRVSPAKRPPGPARRETARQPGKLAGRSRRPGG